MPSDATTPMLKQYLNVKSQHTDSILFFRLGDFYEMFYEDAVEASKILDIALTSRTKGSKEPVPLCGIPHHACQPYIAKLLAAGKKIAICEQVEDPKLAKGVVKREVVRIVTPGMVFDEQALDASLPNYLVCVSGEKEIAFAYLDISTGCFRAGVLPTFETFLDEAAKLDPKEILYPADWPVPLQETLKRHFPTALWQEVKKETFAAGGLPGLETTPETLGVASALWNYACFTQKGEPKHVTAIEPHRIDQFLILDESAQKNLELLKTQTGERAGSLLQLIDETFTPMGARKLRGWLLNPLRSLQVIQARQQAVQTLIDTLALQECLEKGLKGMGDLERVTGRVAIGSANARDLVMLGNSLSLFPSLVAGLQGQTELLGEGRKDLEGFEKLTQKITQTLVEDPPFQLKEGGMIREGINPELDELRAIRKSGKGFIVQLEEKERKATGINSLKVRFNKVFGYYLEVTHTHKEKIPSHYIRKQTLVNAERFITPELKEYEEKVLHAEERIHQLEFEIFLQLREAVADWGPKIQKAADRIAILDCLFSLAKAAQLRRWACPEVNDGDEMMIEEGRHPIVEAFSGERFVPNDICLDGSDNRFLIITGPNMAGKSTVMRQTALIVILAQMGSFVPASRATIGLVDRIFTRVGAMDRMARGESTFMVEMVEVAHILREATPKSLVIIDEVGRGTSTYDGVAIAWAVAEYIHSQVGAKTLFATHYHELIELANSCGGMKNFNIAVKEWNDQIIFLRKLVPGGTDKSYGVEVAKLAGLPKPVIERAKEILAKWERGAKP